MADADRNISKERAVVVWALRAGLALALALMAVGVALALFEGRLTAHPVALAGLWSGLAQGRPSAIMETGVLVLLATPIARVLILIGVFGRARDYRFLGAAVAVAVLLVVGIVLGRL